MSSTGSSKEDLSDFSELVSDSLISLEDDYLLEALDSEDFLLSEEELQRFDSIGKCSITFSLLRGSP